MSRPDALEIATRAYYWKPMAAFFRSLEIGVYLRSGVRFPAPLLDLGCGDGGVAHMLRETGLLADAPHGVDIAHGDLLRAVARQEHGGVYQADANRLPFGPECFASIVCNGVLCSIPRGPERALDEVRRVLKTGGTFVATMPTDEFIEVLPLPRLLGRVSPRLRARYVSGLNARLPHFSAFDSATWAEKLESAGLRVVATHEFFPDRDGRTWNILSMKVFKVLGALRLIRCRPVAAVLGGSLRWALRKAARPSPDGSSRAGYVLMVATKG